jgi:uroporphyrinogen decarboxylase
VAALTKCERVLRTVRFEETDRTPLYDILQNDAVIEHYGGERLTVENGDRVKGVAIGRVLDMTRMPDGPAQPGRVRQENGIELEQERWTTWIVLRPWSDTAGLVEWIEGEIRRAEAATFDRAYAERTHDRIRKWLGRFAAADPTGRNDPAVLILESGVGLTEMYWQVGFEEFAYLAADQPDLVEEWLDARHRAELRRVAAIADPALIPIALTYDDIAFKNGTLFSPAWLRKYWVPRLAQLNAAWHARDVTCLFHSDGKLWGVLDDLVAAGIDGLNPLEVLAGMSVGEARRRQPRLFLTGGIDVSQLLPFGTPDEVRAACRAAIAEADGRGYFLGSTTELHWDVPLENAVAMFETAWEAAPAPG